MTPKTVLIVTAISFLVAAFPPAAQAQDDGSCPDDGIAWVGPLTIASVGAKTYNPPLTVVKLDDGFNNLCYVAEVERAEVLAVALAGIANDMPATVIWEGGNNGIPGQCIRYIRRIDIHPVAPRTLAAIDIPAASLAGRRVAGDDSRCCDCQRDAGCRTDAQPEAAADP